MIIAVWCDKCLLVIVIINTEINLVHINKIADAIKHPQFF